MLFTKEFHKMNVSRRSQFYNQCHCKLRSVTNRIYLRARLLFLQFYTIFDNTKAMIREGKHNSWGDLGNNENTQTQITQTRHLLSKFDFIKNVILLLDHLQRDRLITIGRIDRLHESREERALRLHHTVTYSTPHNTVYRIAGRTNTPIGHRVDKKSSTCRLLVFGRGRQRRWTIAIVADRCRRFGRQIEGWLW